MLPEGMLFTFTNLRLVKEFAILEFENSARF